ncbi:MAG: glycine--tRNA ligase subunit beta [Pseudomonadota bacterium]
MDSAHSDDLFIEIGTEELPPRALRHLSEALTSNLEAGLADARLVPSGSRPFAAPRRLAVLLRGVPARQPSAARERRGPAVSAAFDDNGEPTRAVLGFARSCGCEVTDLETLETDKGAWLVHRYTEEGQPLADLVPDLLAHAVNQLPIPRRMRWGDGEAEFVRPVHWVAVFHGEHPLHFPFLGQTTGAETRGHRFHAPESFTLTHPETYPARLRDAFVIADFDERRTEIVRQVEQTARELGGMARMDDELLEEVTAMVEWPVAIGGRFSDHYLQLPDEVLLSSMQGHQKYFPVIDPDGALLPAFVTVSNIESQEPEQIRAGNERVIRPRLADTEFFWNQDRQSTLESRRPRLASIVFQQQLGTLHDKSKRLQNLVMNLSAQLGYSSDAAERAAALAKCDLLTEMVGEFPELQGTMGRYYALHDGEDPAVADAIAEHYAPRFAGDHLPGTVAGRLLALADRLDTIIGLFGIGQPPTGSKDPYALRRAALGILRILIETRLDLDLGEAIDSATNHFRTQLGSQSLSGATEAEAMAFIMERLRIYYVEGGISHDVHAAVASVEPSRPLDFHQRVTAMQGFIARPEAENLVAANKRTANLLQQADLSEESALHIDPALFAEPAETALYQTLTDTLPAIAEASRERDYDTALDHLASLHQPVDAFFDQVMVMTEEPAIRVNRLALLRQLRQAFLLVADPSRLQSSAAED